MTKSPSNRSSHDLMADIAELDKVIRGKVAEAVPTPLRLSQLSVTPFDFEPFEGARLRLRFHAGRGLEQEIVFTVTHPAFGHPANTLKRREALANEVARGILSAFKHAAIMAATRAEIIAAAASLEQSLRDDGVTSQIIRIAPRAMIVGEPTDCVATTFEVEMVGSFRHATGVTVDVHNTIVASGVDNFAKGFRRWVNFETQRGLEPRLK
jgi:hypothetical protein